MVKLILSFMKATLTSSKAFLRADLPIFVSFVTPPSRIFIIVPHQSFLLIWAIDVLLLSVNPKSIFSTAGYFILS